MKWLALILIAFGLVAALVEVGITWVFEKVELAFRWYDDRQADRRLARIRKSIRAWRDLGASPVPEKLEPKTFDEPADIDQLVADFDTDFKRTHPAGPTRPASDPQEDK